MFVESGAFFLVFLLVSRVWNISTGTIPLAYHWLEDFAGGTPTAAGKTYYKTPLTLCEDLQQSIQLSSWIIYTPLVTNRDRLK
jgi:hypothetical protein